jgi:hypothetical protein
MYMYTYIYIYQFEEWICWICEVGNVSFMCFLQAARFVLFAENDGSFGGEFPGLTFMINNI